MNSTEGEKSRASHKDTPDFVVIDFKTRARQPFTRVEIRGDLIDRPDNRWVSGINQPRFVEKLGRREWRELLITAAAIGVFYGVCSYLPPVP